MAELTTINTIEDNPTTLEYVFEHEGEKHSYHIPRSFTPEEVDNTVLSFITSLEASTEQPDLPDVSNLSADKVRERVDAREFDSLKGQLEAALDTFTPVVDREKAAQAAYETQPLEDEEGNELDPGEAPASPYTDLVSESQDAIASEDTETVRSQLSTVREAISDLRS